MRKKILSILMALIMCIGMLPVTAFAETEAEPDFYAIEANVKKNGTVTLKNEKLTAIELEENDSIDIVVFDGNDKVEASKLNFSSGLNYEVSDTVKEGEDCCGYVITVEFAEGSEEGSIAYGNDKIITFTKKIVNHLYYREVTGEVETTVVFDEMQYDVGEEADVKFYYGINKKNLTVLEVDSITVNVTEGEKTAVKITGPTSGVWHFEFNSEAEATITVGEYEMSVSVDGADVGDSGNNESAKTEPFYRVYENNNGEWAEDTKEYNEFSVNKGDVMYVKFYKRTGSTVSAIEIADDEGFKLESDHTMSKYIDISKPEGAPVGVWKFSFTGGTKDTFIVNDDFEFDLIIRSESVLYCRTLEKDGKEWEEDDEKLRSLVALEGKEIYVRFYYGNMQEEPVDANILKGNVSFYPEIPVGNITAEIEDEDEYIWKISFNESANGLLEIGGNTIQIICVAADDYIDGDIIESDKAHNEGEYRFKYNGKEYVIGFAGDTDPERYVNGTNGKFSDSDKNNTGRASTLYICISEVFEDQGLEGYKTVDSELYAELINEIEIYTAVYSPALHQFLQIKDKDPLYSTTYKFEELAFSDEDKLYFTEHKPLYKEGFHYLVGEAELCNGETCVFSFSFNSEYEKESEIDLTDSKYAGWNIPKINAYIDEMQSEDCENIVFSLNPDVAYEGTLKLKGEKKVSIEGNGATLTGDIYVEREAEGVLHHIEELNLVSSVSGINDQTDIGVYGDGNVFMIKCNFEGFYIAVKTYDETDKTSEQKITAYNCWFKNNNIGVLWDVGKFGYLSGTSNYQFEKCRFENNELGVSIIKHKKIDLVAQLIRFINCEFVDNTEDIENKSDYEYWAHGCFFGKTNTSGAQAEEVIDCPKTEDIIISYVYNKPILSYEDGFIDKFIGENWTPVAPIDEDGNSRDFGYDNTIKDGKYIDLGGFDGKIDVKGDFDIDKNEHKQLGAWKF